MRDCAMGDEICIRTGGDEFVVVAKDYDEAKANAYIRAVREAIRQACLKDKKGYSVTVSIGCYMRVPPEAGVASIQHEAEVFLRHADEAMYEEKKRMEGRY